MTSYHEKVGKSMEASLDQAVTNAPFGIFLCGPSISPGSKITKSAVLRDGLKRELERKKFRVHLGEDDGLLSLKKFGADAQLAEVLFIQEVIPDLIEQKAIIIIADSVGSYCELGLFSWLFARDNSDSFVKDRIGPFFVITNEDYKTAESYLNEGPLKALIASGGRVFHTNFEDFDCGEMVEILGNARALTLSVKKE